MFACREPTHVVDQLDVQLESNPTTGYSWELGPLPDGLELVSSEFEEPVGSLVGAAGTQRFVFDVVGPGIPEGRGITGMFA